ncbi:MAG: class C beta-lactamase-related serine hydrolase [Betaproteobacteria bacterium]|nr:class C beta-lactamase-related serine hydrolase [Betaproteobacteria bacterium]
MQISFGPLGVALMLLLTAQAWATNQVKLSPSGPDAERLGEAQGFPVCPGALIKPECRVGTWSANEKDGLTDIVRALGTAMPLALMRDPPKISYQQSTKSIDDYLAEAKVTGLMILKDGEIVLERYQYGRRPEMRFRSFSMAKTFTAMLVGIAHQKGMIRSLDDKVADYWPEIAASAYGQTTIRNLLYMGSGVPFRELYTWTDGDDNWAWGQVRYAQKNRRRPEAIVEFLNSKTVRDHEQGSRFHYASIETEILGRVLRRATGKTVTKLTEEWIWTPMGAESDARWLLSTTDLAEDTGGGFNATLRDYARFGVLLSNDGRRGDQQIIPLEFLMDATDQSRVPRNFRPRAATPFYGYGYQTWIFPMKERTFALQGIHGQVIYIQPATKIVMVQTAVFDRAGGSQDPAAWRRNVDLWYGVLRSLGGRINE